MMDNDPQHVEAAYQAAKHRKEKKLEVKAAKMEFALQTILEAPELPVWIKELVREALK